MTFIEIPYFSNMAYSVSAHKVSGGIFDAHKPKAGGLPRARRIF